MSNYATKKELNDATGVDRFNLSAKRNFIVLKVEVYKLDINKLDNIPVSLNNLQTKVDYLVAVKLKTVPLDLNIFSDAVSKKVVKYIKFNKLNTKVNSLENKIPNSYFNSNKSTHNTTHKQSLGKKLEMLIKKYLTLVV